MRSHGLSIFTAVLLVIMSGCASPEMVSASDESTARAKISPAQAMKLASPHLEAVFKLRCESRLDKSWCKKPAGDQILLLGEHYHIARESYPYKTINAYIEPAIRIHKETGEVILPDGLKP
jgi:hypothetical protein